MELAECVLIWNPQTALQWIKSRRRIHWVLTRPNHLEQRTFSKLSVLVNSTVDGLLHLKIREKNLKF